jgi:phosphatidylserine/phosphatidylglycerophosphate/cardiolipin synthase-like enzyme
MARPPHSLKKEKLVEGVGGLRILDDVGIKIHKLKGLKLHGKMLLADGIAAIVGSINLAPGSFDSRRELAIEVRDDDVVERLHEIAKHDWKNSHPLDLSDEGLLADLEDREEGAAEELAIDADAKTRKKAKKEADKKAEKRAARKGSEGKKASSPKKKKRKKNKNKKKKGSPAKSTKKPKKARKKK